MAMGSTQSLTEMSTRNSPGGKRRPARMAHNLSIKCGNVDVPQPYGPSRPVIGIALPSFLVYTLYVYIYTQ
jgi:hypothetical protein